MMIIGLGLTCDRLPPKGATSGTALVVFPFSDGDCRVAAADIRSEDCRRMLQMLAECGIRYRSYNFALKLPKDAWDRPDRDWVGAVALGDDLVGIDPDNAFDPRFPPPCYGMVPPGRPIRILSRPKGHVAAAKSERVVSSRFCDILRSHAEGDTADVLLAGQRLEGWHRWLPRQTRGVICGESLKTFTCLACGTAGTTDVGVWLGRRIGDLSVCQDERGCCHQNARRLQIMSVDVAQDLERRLRRGYGLTPVIDIASEWGQTALQLLPAIQALRAPAE